MLIVAVFCGTGKLGGWMCLHHGGSGDVSGDGGGDDGCGGGDNSGGGGDAGCRLHALFHPSL